MEVTLQGAGVAIAAVAVVTGLATYFMTKRKAAAAHDKAEGARDEKLEDLEEDMQHINTVELPRLQRIEVLTEKNATAIYNLTKSVDRLSEMQGERTRLLDRALDKLMEGDKRK